MVFTEFDNGEEFLISVEIFLQSTFYVGLVITDWQYNDGVYLFK